MQKERSLTNITANRKAFPINCEVRRPLRKMEDFRAYFGVALDLEKPVATSLYPTISIWIKSDQVSTIRLAPSIPNNILEGAIDPMRLMRVAKIIEKENDLDPIYGWVYALEVMAASVIAPIVGMISFKCVPGIGSWVLASMAISGRNYKCKRESFGWREFLHNPY